MNRRAITVTLVTNRATPLASVGARGLRRPGPPADGAERPRPRDRGARRSQPRSLAVSDDDLPDIAIHSFKQSGKALSAAKGQGT